MSITPIEIHKFCVAIEKKANEKSERGDWPGMAMWKARALCAHEIAHYIALHIYEKKSKKPKASELFY